MTEHYIKTMKKYFEKQSYYSEFMTKVSKNKYWKDVNEMIEALVWRGLKKTKA